MGDAVMLPFFPFFFGGGFAGAPVSSPYISLECNQPKKVLVIAEGMHAASVRQHSATNATGYRRPFPGPFPAKPCIFSFVFSDRNSIDAMESHAAAARHEPASF